MQLQTTACDVLSKEDYYPTVQNHAVICIDVVSSTLKQLLVPAGFFLYRAIWLATHGVIDGSGRTASSLRSGHPSVRKHLLFKYWMIFDEIDRKREV